MSVHKLKKMATHSGYSRSIVVTILKSMWPTSKNGEKITCRMVQKMHVIFRNTATATTSTIKKYVNAENTVKADRGFQLVAAYRQFLNLAEDVNYRPQRSCSKVMFLHLSVILSTGGPVLQTHPLADTPSPDTPWANISLGQIAPNPPGRHPP